MKPEHTEYEIRLRPLPGTHNAPAVRRLARWLKRMLRAYGFVCISAKEIKVSPCHLDSKAKGKAK